MEKIVLRKATLDDKELLQAIQKQTFAETYSSDNKAENMRDYLENHFSVEKIINELSDKNSAFFLAELEDAVVGYLKVNSGESQTELKEENALEVERIYVQKEYQGKKIGQLLINKAIEISKQLNKNYVWLGVWEKNPRAIRFYKKIGFVEFDRHIFKLGDEEQTDIMMKIPIT